MYTEDELDTLSIYVTNYKEIHKPSHTELPKDFSYFKNHKKLEKMKYILEEMKIHLQKYEIVHNKDIYNKDSCNKDIYNKDNCNKDIYNKDNCNKDICNIFVDCETLEEIDTLYYQKNIYYKKEKKEISSKRNTIYLEDIPIIQEIRLCMKNTISISYEYLDSLTKKIVEYDNIDKLVQYKNTQETEKYIENNRVLDEKIIMLENMYKIAYKEYYTKRHILYNKKYKKYKKYEDIFLYNSYNRYNDIIKYKKYKEILAKQEEFEKYKKVEKEQIYYRKEQDQLEKECNILKQQIAKIEDYNKKMLQDKENICIKIEKIQLYQTYSENQQKIHKIQKDIKKQEIRISYIADKELYEKKEEYEKIYSKNKELQKTIQDFTNNLIQYKKELVDIEKKYNNTKTFLIEISFSIKNILEKQEDKRKIVDHITKLQNNRKDIQYDIELYTKYLLLVHKNGIPKKCIHTKISYIQEYMNICLQDVVDFSISIEVENNNIQFVFHKNSMCLDFEQLSGYERFIVHISCKIALQKYSFTSKSTLFIIDEGLDVIDKNNIPKLQNILQTMKKSYNHILLLSHYTTICSIVDNVY